MSVAGRVNTAAITQGLTVLDRLLLAVFRAFPPRETIFKDPTTRPLEEYEDERRFGFHLFFGEGEEMWHGRDVLDLGSGFGGRPIAYLERGAKTVTGVEVSEEMLEHARRFAASRGERDVTFRLGRGERIPSEDASFDLVVMNDVMEHVVSPADVLAECWRVLRPGGRLALVFPPYYDITAGSHLHGYATTFPGLNLVFSTRQLKSATSALLAERGVDTERFLREVPSDKLWNQNGLTVRGFKRLVRSSRFEPELMRFLGHADHRISGHRGFGAALRLPLFLLAELPAQFPLLQEAFCLRVCALLRK